MILRSLLTLCLTVLCTVLWMSPTMAAPENQTVTCCVCTSGPNSGNTCVYVPEGEGGSNCSGLSDKYPSLKGYSCNPPLFAESGCTSKNTSASGICNVGPTDIQAFKPPPPPTGAAQSKVAPLIMPKLNVAIPGLTFADSVYVDGQSITVPFLAQYISAVYRYLIGIAAIAAAIMVLYGGFLIIVAETGAKVRHGKDLITDALIGLALVLGALIILQLVNPNTIKSQGIKLLLLSERQWHGDEESDLPADKQGTPLTIRSATVAATTAASAVASGETLTGTVPTPTGGATTIALPKAICAGSACKALCDGCGPKANLPDAPNIAAPKDLVTIPSAPGLQGSGQLRREAVDALVKAGAAAQSWPGGPYTIRILSTARPLVTQVALACQKYCSGRDSEVGINVATPGGSLHGSGLAVDMELWKDKQKLVSCCTVATQTSETKKENAELLQQIMSSVGWVRYCTEVWHFEWSTDSIPGRSKNCPWPPR